MATRQSLKGSPTKIYEIVNVFNKGFNTSVADDLLSENVFRDLNNFLPSEEGNITKRPGINRSKLRDLFNGIYNKAYDEELLTVKVSGSTNDTSVSESEKTKIDYLYRNIFKLENFTNTMVDTDAVFIPTLLSNFTIIEDNKLLDYLGKFDELLDVENNSEIYKQDGYMSAILIFLGDYIEEKTNFKTKALRIVKFDINLEYAENNFIMNINYEMRQPLRNSINDRLTFRYDGDEIIDLAIYANSYYFMNGYDALIKINKEISNKTTIQDDSIVEYYKRANNLYKPTAIEISNIGFNILSESPLTYIDSQGTADTIRGTFFTYQDEPTQIVPYNKEFKIHILSSGSSANGKPQYRDNNGEVDVEKNPYKDLPGSYNTDKTIFTCTGLNESGSYEMKITKGTDDYITYFTMGTTPERQIGKISDISSLVFSSKYCKVINNQLVLYGDHGYLFYSDYDRFNYFPNYYYVYAAETENEQVMGLTYFRQYYALFTNKRIKRLSGTFGSENFGLYPLNDSVGCANSKTIKQAQNYIYFLSYNGLYILKQGYLGEGTENVEQIDLPIYKSYDSESMLKASVIQNFYTLYSNKEALLYNYVNDAFYKLKTANSIINDEKTGKVKESIYSIPFQYNELQNDLLYGIIVKIDNNIDYFDICYQNYSEDAIERTDNGSTFISEFETPFMSFGMPTNTKKFKEVYFKFYNKNGLDVPIYVTIKVDDDIVVSPSKYEIIYDEETSTYSYIEKTEANAEIKGYNVLGTLTIDKDVLGEKTLQILKLKVGAKGKSIKVIVSDGLDKVDNKLVTDQNKYRFDLSTFGVVYKVKKVKEG